VNSEIDFYSKQETVCSFNLHKGDKHNSKEIKPLKYEINNQTNKDRKNQK